MVPLSMNSATRFGDAFAYALDLRQGFLSRQFDDVDILQLLDHAGAIGQGSDAEGIVAVELHELAEAGKKAGDLRIRGRWHGHQ